MRISASWQIGQGTSYPGWRLHLLNVSWPFPTRLCINGDGDIRAYGWTSNLGYSFDHVRPNDSGNAEAETASGASNNATQRDGEVSLIVPPGYDMKTIEHLLHLYFLWLQPVFPVVSRIAFLSDMSGKGGLYFSSLLLNAILALASQLSDWPW